MGQAKKELIETILSMNMTDSEARSLGVVFRRISSGEIHPNDYQEFIRLNDAPTREEAFAAMAAWHPMRDHNCHSR